MSQPIFKVPGIRPAMFHYSPPGGGGSKLKCQGPVLPGQLHIIWEARYINGGPPDNPTDKQGLADGATVSRWPDRTDHYPEQSPSGTPIYHANGGPGGAAAQYAGAPSTPNGGGPFVTFAPTGSNTGLRSLTLPFLTYNYCVIVCNIWNTDRTDGDITRYGTTRSERGYYANTDTDLPFNPSAGVPPNFDNYYKNGVPLPNSVRFTGQTGNDPYDLGQPAAQASPYAPAWRVYEAWSSTADPTNGQDTLNMGTGFICSFDLALLYVAPEPAPTAAQRDQLLNYIKYWYGITSTLP